MQRDCTLLQVPGRYSQTKTVSRRDVTQTVSFCHTKLLSGELAKSSATVRTRPTRPARMVSVETGRGFLNIETVPVGCELKGPSTNAPCVPPPLVEAR